MKLYERPGWHDTTSGRIFTIYKTCREQTILGVDNHVEILGRK